MAELGPQRDRPPRPLLAGHPNRSPAALVDQEAAVTLKFSDLNPLGRAIIITVAVLTFGVAAVSFATSYGALYAYARDNRPLLRPPHPPVAPAAGWGVHRRATGRHPGRHPAGLPRLADPDHAPDRRLDGLV